MISYNPLKKLLIDRKMKPEHLRRALNLSFNTMSHISKDEYVEMQTIDKICNYLNCRVEDVMEHVKDDKL